MYRLLVLAKVERSERSKNIVQFLCHIMKNIHSLGSGVLPQDSLGVFTCCHKRAHTRLESIGGFDEVAGLCLLAVLRGVTTDFAVITLDGRVAISIVALTPIGATDYGLLPHFAVKPGSAFLV